MMYICMPPITDHYAGNKSMVAERLDTRPLSHVTLDDGEARVKRIAFLAEVRNRALRPIETSEVVFDKLLYLNDVIFDPVDAANLLFSTNVDDKGRTQYRAACAVDFMENAFKFYDTYATRDLEGNAMGVIVYPWFTTAGLAQSRQDVFDQKDAVRVRSCWGGMVAFEAKWFQFGGSPPDPVTNATVPVANRSVKSRQAAETSSQMSKPLRFRAETEMYWDASECCLIHADLQEMDPSHDPQDTGIYLNPYVRVAYSESTHRFINLARHFERLLGPVQNQLNYLARMPPYNPRRLDKAGSSVTNRVWTVNEGQDPHDVRSAGDYQDVTRIASAGAYCGGRKLSVIGSEEDVEAGKTRWWGAPVPTDLGQTVVF